MRSCSIVVGALVLATLACRPICRGQAPGEQGARKSAKTPGGTDGSAQLPAQPSVQILKKARYADTTDGLCDLLNDMAAAAKAGDATRLRFLIASTEIPDSETWFVKTFGAEKGESWAGPYEKLLKRREAALEAQIGQLGQRPGYFSAKEIVPTDMYDTLQTPLDLFLARWSPPDVDGLQRRPTEIGYFFYIDGTFRWNSTAMFADQRR